MRFRDDIDSLLIEVSNLKRLATLLEDYFYNNRGDEEFNKHLVLSTVVVEKIQQLDDNLNKLYDKEVEREKENIKQERN